MPPEVILGVLDNRYPDLARDRPKTGGEYLADLMARPARERASALADIYRQDPAMGRNVVGLLKTQAKGRTEHDKLLLGLGVADGERSAYLRDKLATLPAGADRRAWLVDLRRKGIITDEVFRQMAAPPKR